jgi:MYXO-CTERM domain-containing protein
MKKLYVLLVVAGLALTSRANAQTQNLIQNGGFETGTFADWTVGSTETEPFVESFDDGENAQVVNSPSGDPAWFLRNVSANYFNSFPGTSTSPISNYTAFNGFDGSGGTLYLQQGFSVTSTLQVATLGFTFGTQSDYAGVDRTFAVNILSSGGAVLATPFTYTLPDSNYDWSTTTENLDLTSTLNSLGAGSYQIQFMESVPGDFTGPASFGIDNIALNTEAAPEPSSWSLGLIALAVVVHLRRRAISGAFIKISPRHG